VLGLALLAAVGSAVVEPTVAFTVRSPATPQLTPRALLALAPAASEPRLQVTFVMSAAAPSFRWKVA